MALRRETIAMHHHVAPTDDADAARLVRFIDGTNVGIRWPGEGTAVHGAYRGLQGTARQRGFGFDIIGGTPPALR